MSKLAKDVLRTAQPFTSKRYAIRTIGGLIKALGGARRIGEAFGVTIESVEGWARRGCIPGGWHLLLYTIASWRGRTVHPRVFNLSNDSLSRLDSRLTPPKRARGRRKNSRAADVRLAIF